MAETQIRSVCCPRAQSVCEYRSTDFMNSVPAGDSISGEAAGALARRECRDGVRQAKAEHVWSHRWHVGSAQ